VGRSGARDELGYPRTEAAASPHVYRLSLKAVDRAVVVSSGSDFSPFIGHVAPFDLEVGVDLCSIECDHRSVFLGYPS
jgi:hypothetical protein